MIPRPMGIDRAGGGWLRRPDGWTANNDQGKQARRAKTTAASATVPVLLAPIG